MNLRERLERWIDANPERALAIPLICAVLVFVVALCTAAGW